MFKINLGKTLKPIIYVPRKNNANKKSKERGREP